MEFTDLHWLSLYFLKYRIIFCVCNLHDLYLLSHMVFLLLSSPPAREERGEEGRS